MSREREFWRTVLAEVRRWLRLQPSKKKQLFLPAIDKPSEVITNARLAKYHYAFGTVIDVLEARDEYTARHSNRVANMAFRFCMCMRLSRSRTNVILTTASFHDIGKVGVGDSILRKKTRLSEDEWAEIERHPDIGADVLDRSPGLSEVAQGVRHHHERWDGKGYPSGLAGDSIPLPARIIAVCDSIDAMMSDRPYRSALTPEQCKAELQKNSGVMYEPQLIELCLSQWEAITGGLYQDENNQNKGGFKDERSENT